MDRHFLAGLLFAIATARFTILLISAGQLRETNAARSVINAMLAVLLAGGLILTGTMLSRKMARGGDEQASDGQVPLLLATRTAQCLPAMFKPAFPV